MTLTTRVSTYFLAVLAGVLAAFSAALLLMSRNDLYRQADDQLHSALGVLAAAVEVGEDGVEWEPQERELLRDNRTGASHIVWRVTDETGLRLDGSQGGAEREILDAWGAEFTNLEDARAAHAADGSDWKLARRTVRSQAATVSVAARQGPADAPAKSAAIIVTAGVSLEPAQATLRKLAATVGGLSIGLWLLAAATGRAVCRRALAPLTGMAQAARSMQAAQRETRLPAPATGDELENLGQAFNGLLDRLQESFERQQRFTGDASHQLRTPLTIMQGQVEVALRRDRPPDEYRRALESVAVQSGRLRQIIETLLFLSRADSEAKLPNLETLDLGQWLKIHLEQWSTHSRRSDTHLEIEADRPQRIEAHGPLLGQLIDNLLDNAFKYSQPGTPVTIRLHGLATGCRLSIEDAGCGIRAQEASHIFEPFYRSPSARGNGHEGVGLGLAVAQRIAGALGGSISVTSQVAHGSCFIVELPQASDNV
jgi:heavy metal sensor kinase